MGFTVHLMLTQYYMFYSVQCASLQTLIFSALTITELLKHDVVLVFYDGDI